MLAKALWIIQGIEFVTYFLLLLYLNVTPEFAVFIALGLHVCVRAFVVGLSFGLALVFWVARPVAMQISAIDTIKLIVFEIASWLVLYSVFFPLEPWLEYEYEPENETEALPVLLIHGLLCNGAVWWSMQRYLRRFRITRLYTVNLEPLFGDIEQFAQQVAERIDNVRRETGVGKVILVAHSMGGLAARAYLCREGAEDHVAKLITLGTPHHGTHIAQFLFGENLRQMRVGSRWLGMLNAMESQPTTTSISSIFSYHDNLVAPQYSSILSNARSIPLTGTGHLTMLFSRRIHRLVREQILSVGKVVR